MPDELADFSAAGLSTATGISGAGFAAVTGLPGVAYEQDGVYFDSAWHVSTAAVDVEFVELKNSRTGMTRLVSLSQLATLLA